MRKKAMTVRGEILKSNLINLMWIDVGCEKIRKSFTI
jgi:hypothetical protein